MVSHGETYTSSPPAGGAVSPRLGQARFSVSAGDRFIAAPLLRSPQGEAKKFFSVLLSPFLFKKGAGFGAAPQKHNPYINPMIRQNSGFVARLPAFFDRCLTACRMPGGIRRKFRLPPPRQPLKRLRSRRYALHVRVSRRHFFE